MKKIASLLFVALTAVMLSSCIYINTEDPKYSMYFNNDTSAYIYDWYLKDTDGRNYTKSDRYCEVPSNTTSKMDGLKEKDYQVWFCYYSTRSTDFYMYTQNYVHLDEDTVFYLSDRSFHYRSANGNDNETTEPSYVLTTSDGEVLELKTCVINKETDN